MDSFAEGRFTNTAADTKAVLALVFREGQTEVPRQISRCGRVLKVVDQAQTGDDAVNRATVLQPDVVLMLTADAMPSAEFTRAAHGLYRARLADRVVMIVDNPAGYLLLAVKTGAAALLHTRANSREVMRTLAEVVALCDNRPPLAPGQPGNPQCPDREVSDM